MLRLTTYRCSTETRLTCKQKTMPSSYNRNRRLVTLGSLLEDLHYDLLMMCHRGELSFQNYEKLTDDILKMKGLARARGVGRPRASDSDDKALSTGDMAFDELLQSLNVDD